MEEQEEIHWRSMVNRTTVDVSRLGKGPDWAKFFESKVIESKQASEKIALTNDLEYLVRKHYALLQTMDPVKRVKAIAQGVDFFMSVIKDDYTLKI
jgi:hypothetical protein